MDCCGGVQVDLDYLCALQQSAASAPFGVGAKLLSISSAQACGYTTGVFVQSRFTILANEAHITATIGDVTWTAEDTDPLGLITPSGATFTVPAGGGGYYTVQFGGTWSGNATTRNTALLVVTAAATHVSRTYAVSGDIGGVNIGGHWGPFPLAAGDTFKVQVVQSSGGTLQLNPATLLVTWQGTT